MLPLRRMTTNAASIRRRASLAYVARRSATARSAMASSTAGTTFCTAGTVFRIPTQGQPRLREPRHLMAGLAHLGLGALLEAFDQKGALDLAGGGGAGERLDDR